MPFLRHLEEALGLQALILTEPFSHPSICCRDRPAGHKLSRRFLECIDGNFLTQMIAELITEVSLLYLILTDKEYLYVDMKLGGSFGCSDHERVELRILRAGEKW